MAYVSWLVNSVGHNKKALVLVGMTAIEIAHNINAGPHPMCVRPRARRKASRDYEGGSAMCGYDETRCRIQISVDML